MTAQQWQTKKKTDKNQYHTSMGTTDYDIPMFGLRSAFLIAAVMMGTLMLMSALKAPRIVTAGVTGILSGLSVAYAQYFLETKQGITKKFWIVFAAITAVVVISVMLF
jgi:hypothetical protein